MLNELITRACNTTGADAAVAWSQLESAACARRLAAAAKLLDAMYAASGSAHRNQWCSDNWPAICAHVGDAQRSTPELASETLLMGLALRDRFPKVQALFSAGLTFYDLVKAVLTRTAHVTDTDVLLALDTALTEALPAWGPMSAEEVAQAIDAIVARTHSEGAGRAS
jgi:hypothetical protein